MNLGSDLLAGFTAAIVCQPADTMLSKINKTKGLLGEGVASRLIKIAGELGIRGSLVVCQHDCSWLAVLLLASLLSTVTLRKLSVSF